MATGPWGAGVDASVWLERGLDRGTAQLEKGLGMCCSCCCDSVLHAKVCKIDSSR